MDKRRIKVLLISIVVIVLMIPIILEFFIFRNTFQSPVDNNGWASFLGSYLGGVLGGLCTLATLFVTVRESQRIQRDNKDDTERQIQDERKRHDAEIDNQYRLHEKDKRTAFADLIADDIGIYIAHISQYHYAGLHAITLKAEVDAAFSEMKKAEDSKLNAIKEFGSGIDKSEIKILESECYVDKCKFKYEELKNKKEENSKNGDRLRANEVFFTLQVKLNDIVEAKELLAKLYEFHNGTGKKHNEKKFGEWIENIIEDVKVEYSLFRKRYIEKYE